MRILISPRPTNRGGPGIFLSRVASELTRRGYKWTSNAFHYTGLPWPAWDYAFMMGYPRRGRSILESGKPVITTMGKPESRKELRAVGRDYLPEYEVHELFMADAINRSPKIVFISQYVSEIWKEIFRARRFPFPDPQRARVIHHGVDVERFSPSKTVVQSPFVVGLAGAIRDKFRLATFFSASRLLAFDHRLLIVGSMTPECKDEYEREMRDPRLRAITTYIPWVDQNDLPAVYRRMHCLFHPVDYEGFGIVVAEALACGVPVVVPSHGAPKEYVPPHGGVVVETEQFTYDEEFSERMAGGITKVREKWSEFSMGARETAQRNLSIVGAVDAYLDFMDMPRFMAARAASERG